MCCKTCSYCVTEGTTEGIKTKGRRWKTVFALAGGAEGQKEDL